MIHFDTIRALLLDGLYSSDTLEELLTYYIFLRVCTVRPFI